MRYIRKIERYIPNKLKGKYIYFYLPIDDIHLLNEIGFTSPFINGESVIPSPHLNRATRENSEGKVIIRKDLPKEKYDQYIEFVAPNFGDFSKGSHTISFVKTIERYVRENTLPYSLALNLIIRNDKYYVYSKLYKYSEKNKAILTALINIYRFTFGNIPLFSEDQTGMPLTIIKNEWEFFKKGVGMKKLKNFVRTSIKKKNEQTAIIKRLDYFEQKSIDDTIQIGQNGFLGYFCIKTKKHYVFESIYTNNATYIIDSSDDWKTISSFTKTQVIKKALAKRYYHTIAWKSKIEQIL